MVVCAHVYFFPPFNSLLALADQLMTRISQTERIRQLIEKKLIQRGASEDSEIHETILIHGGNYCGRRYEFDGFQAVWFVEENQIKYYSEDGILLEVVVLDTNSSRDQQKAA